MEIEYEDAEVEMVGPDGITFNVFLFQAKKDCKHEEDTTNWSGIHCKKCSGWFCY